MTKKDAWKIKVGHFLRLCANYLDEKDLESHAAKKLNERYKVFDVQKTLDALRSSLLNNQYPYKSMLMRVARGRELWQVNLKGKPFYFIWEPRDKVFVTFYTKEMAHSKVAHLEKQKQRLKNKYK